MFAKPSDRNRNLAAPLTVLLDTVRDSPTVLVMIMNNNQLKGRPARDLTPIRFQEMGEGEQSILFLHGLFGSPDNWQSIMEDLADQYRLVALQLPIDHQPGRRKNGVTSVSEITDYVELVVDQLQLKRTILCGNSLGGLVSIDFCIRHSQHVAGLVLTGSAGLFENDLYGGRRPRATREYVRHQAKEIFHSETHVTDAMVDNIYRSFQDRDYVRFILRMARATRDYNIKDDLCKLTIPTLVVWGRNDRITPPSVGEEFRDSIQNAQLEILDECGHSPNVEQPEEFSRILKQFSSAVLLDPPTV